MAVLDVHESCVKTSAMLSMQQMPYVIPLIEVIEALNDAGISFVLVGAHGLAGWRNKARATEDVDVIVAAKHLKKAVRVLLAVFPTLEAQDLPVVVRLKDQESGKVLINVMKPNQQLFRAVFQHTHTVSSGGQEYSIPSLEMALAMKFAPMVSLNRADEDKYLDAHDFMHMVKSNPNIDLVKLSELGEFVYPGGGAEVVEMVRRTLSGEKLNL